MEKAICFVSRGSRAIAGSRITHCCCAAEASVKPGSEALIRVPAPTSTESSLSAWTCSVVNTRVASCRLAGEVAALCKVQNSKTRRLGCSCSV